MAPSGKGLVIPARFIPKPGSQAFPAPPGAPGAGPEAAFAKMIPPKAWPPGPGPGPGDMKDDPPGIMEVSGPPEVSPEMAPEPNAA